MLARAAASAAAAARLARHRPLSALATAGLDPDTADLHALASDFAARELAPHSDSWDRDSVRGGVGGVSGGVVAVRRAPRHWTLPPPTSTTSFSTSRCPPCAPLRPPASPRSASRPCTAARG